MAAITFVGNLPVVSATDLASKAHNINYSGARASEHEGINKYAGMLVMVNTAAGKNTLAVALGRGDTAKWTMLDNVTADVTPA